MSKGKSKSKIPMKVTANIAMPSPPTAWALGRLSGTLMNFRLVLDTCVLSTYNSFWMDDTTWLTTSSSTAVVMTFLGQLHSHISPPLALPFPGKTVELMTSVPVEEVSMAEFRSVVEIEIVEAMTSVPIEDVSMAVVRGLGEFEIEMELICSVIVVGDIDNEVSTEEIIAVEIILVSIVETDTDSDSKSDTSIEVVLAMIRSDDEEIDSSSREDATDVVGSMDEVEDDSEEENDSKIDADEDNRI